MTSRVRLARIIAAMLALLAGCSSSTFKSSGPASCSITDSCPCVMVALDGGTDAFSGVGEYLYDQKLDGGPCQQVCGSANLGAVVLVCELVTETTVRCSAGCD